MGIATTIVLVLNVLAFAALVYLAIRAQSVLHGWVRAAISDEIRRQDDRIQKRLERMEGRPADVVSTDVDSPYTGLPYRVGQPMRRNRDGP